MKHIFFSAAIAATIFATDAYADVKIQFPEGSNLPSEITVEKTLISQQANAKSRRDIKPVKFQVPVNGGKAEFDTDSLESAAYVVSVTPKDQMILFAAPQDNLLVSFPADSANGYIVSGTPLMEGITNLSALTAPLQNEYVSALSQENPDKNRLAELADQFDATTLEFIRSNPESPAVAYAVMNLEGEKLMDAYNSMTEQAKQSILYPLLEKQYQQTVKRAEQEKHQHELASGAVDAPAFTLKDTAGKDVSLSDFKGKWVILDFWGTWCPWCIKGFPKLKEAYSQYAGRLEVIGIDNGDTEQAWKDGVKKHELPWVNVYNPESNRALLESYSIQGFPTKVIINPEGKIVDITTGEDPEFYTRLSKFMGK